MKNNRNLNRHLKELGYDRKTLKKTTEDIANCDDDILEAIEEYIKSYNIKNISEDMVDIEMMIESYKMNPISAYLFLDWYRKEPNRAIKCLGLGFDMITDLPSYNDSEVEKIDQG